MAGRPTLHVEWMDTKRQPEAEARQRLARYLAEKYVGRRFDLLVTVDDNALEFATKQKMFAGVPIVFAGINGDPRRIAAGRANVTGVADRFDLSRTINLAQRLHPEVRRLVFMTTADESGAGSRAHIADALRGLGKGIVVEHWVTRNLSEVEARLPLLGDDTLLFALGPHNPW